MRRSLWLFVALLLAPNHPAAAQTGGDILWTFQGLDDVWGISGIEDKNADGHPDVLIESYDSGAPSGNHMFLLSGGSSGVATAIWGIHPTGGVSSGGGYGATCLAASPDLNGDGGQDALLGTAWGGRTAYGVDGATGAILWDFDTYVDTPPVPAVSGWVYQVSPQADVTGDGVPEILVACGSDNNGGYCLNGATGASHYRLQANDALGCVVSPGDVNGDGYADAVFGGMDNETRLFGVSGRWSGPAVALWVRDLGATIYSVDALDDVSGDGRHDVVAGCWNGNVYGIRSSDGVILWTHFVGDNIMQVRAGDDVNGDGHKDVAVASWANAAIVLNGATGAQIWNTPVGTLNGGDVWAIDWVPDIDGDGRDEVVAGSFDLNAYLFDGATGVERWHTFLNNRVYNVRSVSDLNGNGRADVVVGTQKLTGQPGGIAYALEGGQATVSVESAVLHAESASGGVNVSWFVEGIAGNASFHVYRRSIREGEMPPDALKAARAASHARHEVRARDLVDAISASEPDRYDRLTREPVQGTGPSFSFFDRSARPGERYEYRVALVLAGGGESLLPASAEVTVPVLTAWLGVPAPNPALGSALIPLKLPAGDGSYRLDLFDANGRWIRTLATGELSGTAVSRNVTWDGRDASGRPAASGVYLSRLEAAGAAATGRIVLAR